MGALATTSLRLVTFVIKRGASPGRPRRQAAIGVVPPATSGACLRAAGADAALLELAGDRGCPVIDRLPVASR